MAGAMTRWDPFAELGSLFDGPDRSWAPAVDVVRDDGQIVVHADVPGFKPEEVKIEISDGVLTISGEREESKEENEKNYIRRERRYGSFSRSIALPSGVDPGAVKATTHEGVVDVTVPLPEEAKQDKVTITPTAA